MISEAKNIDRYSVVKMENGTIGIFERKNLTVLVSENDKFKQSWRVRADEKLEIIMFPVQLAKFYIVNKNLNNKIEL